MPTTTSLDTSRKLAEILGFTETTFIWFWSKKKASRKCTGKNHPVHEHPEPFICIWADELKNLQNDPMSLIAAGKVFPAYTFGELLRVLPRLKKEKKCDSMAETYIMKKSEQEAMEAVEKLLKV